MNFLYTTGKSFTSNTPRDTHINITDVYNSSKKCWLVTDPEYRRILYYYGGNLSFSFGYDFNYGEYDPDNLEKIHVESTVDGYELAQVYTPYGTTLSNPHSAYKSMVGIRMISAKAGEQMTVEIKDSSGGQKVLITSKYEGGFSHLSISLNGSTAAYETDDTGEFRCYIYQEGVNLCVDAHRPGGRMISPTYNIPSNVLTSVNHTLVITPQFFDSGYGDYTPYIFSTKGLGFQQLYKKGYTIYFKNSGSSEKLKCVCFDQDYTCTSI